MKKENKYLIGLKKFIATWYVIILMGGIWSFLGYLLSCGVKNAATMFLCYLTGTLLIAEGPMIIGSIIGRTIILTAINNIISVFVHTKGSFKLKINYVKKEFLQSLKAINEDIHTLLEFKNRSFFEYIVALMGLGLSIIICDFITGDGQFVNSFACIVLIPIIADQASQKRGFLIALTNMILKKLGYKEINGDLVICFLDGMMLGGIITSLLTIFCSFKSIIIVGIIIFIVSFIMVLVGKKSYFRKIGIALIFVTAIAFPIKSEAAEIVRGEYKVTFECDQSEIKEAWLLPSVQFKTITGFIDQPVKVYVVPEGTRCYTSEEYVERWILSETGSKNRYWTISGNEKDFMFGRSIYSKYSMQLQDLYIYAHDKIDNYVGDEPYLTDSNILYGFNCDLSASGIKDYDKMIFVISENVDKSIYSLLEDTPKAPTVKRHDRLGILVGNNEKSFIADCEISDIKVIQITGYERLEGEYAIMLPEGVIGYAYYDFPTDYNPFTNEYDYVIGIHMGICRFENREIEYLKELGYILHTSNVDGILTVTDKLDPNYYTVVDGWGPFTVSNVPIPEIVEEEVEEVIEEIEEIVEEEKTEEEIIEEIVEEEAIEEVIEEVIEEEVIDDSAKIDEEQEETSIQSIENEVVQDISAAETKITAKDYIDYVTAPVILASLLIPIAGAATASSTSTVATSFVEEAIGIKKRKGILHVNGDVKIPDFVQDKMDELDINLNVSDADTLHWVFVAKPILPGQGKIMATNTAQILSSEAVLKIKLKQKVDKDTTFYIEIVAISIDINREKNVLEKMIEINVTV